MHTLLLANLDFVFLFRDSRAVDSVNLNQRAVTQEKVAVSNYATYFESEHHRCVAMAYRYIMLLTQPITGAVHYIECMSWRVQS